MPHNERTIRIAESYQERSVRLAQAASTAVATMVATIDRGEIAESFGPIIGDAERVVVAGQQRSRDLALGFFAATGRAELGRDVEIAPVIEDNVGTTSDGRAVAEVLAGVRGRFFRELEEGREVDDALVHAREGFARAAVFEVMQAGSIELENQFDASDDVVGWRSRSRGTCGACLAMDDGVVRSTPQRRLPPYHPHCFCVPEAVYDVEETVTRPTGPDRFASLGEGEQDRLLGRPKATLLRRGLVPWSALVSINQFEEWDPVITEAPLEKLLVVASMTKEELQELIAA